MRTRPHYGGWRTCKSSSAVVFAGCERSSATRRSRWPTSAAYIAISWARLNAVSRTLPSKASGPSLMGSGRRCRSCCRGSIETPKRPTTCIGCSGSRGVQALSHTFRIFEVIDAQDRSAQRGNDAKKNAGSKCCTGGVGFSVRGNAKQSLSVLSTPCIAALHPHFRATIAD